MPFIGIRLRIAVRWKPLQSPWVIHLRRRRARMHLLAHLHILIQACIHARNHTRILNRRYLLHHRWT